MVNCIKNGNFSGSSYWSFGHISPDPSDPVLGSGSAYFNGTPAKNWIEQDVSTIYVTKPLHLTFLTRCVGYEGSKMFKVGITYTDDYYEERTIYSGVDDWDDEEHSIPLISNKTLKTVKFFQPDTSYKICFISYVKGLVKPWRAEVKTSCYVRHNESARRVEQRMYWNAIKSGTYYRKVQYRKNGGSWNQLNWSSVTATSGPPDYEQQYTYGTTTVSSSISDGDIFEVKWELYYYLSGQYLLIDAHQEQCTVNINGWQ